MTLTPERAGKPVKPPVLSLTDGEAIAAVVTRGSRYAYTGVERGFRQATPVLVDRLEVLLRERLGVTPKQWARLEPVLREELQHVLPLVAAAAAREVRTRQALDASVTLKPRMKGDE